MGFVADKLLRPLLPGRCEGFPVAGVKNDALRIREEPYPILVLEFVNRESYNVLKKEPAQGLRCPNDMLLRGASAGFAASIRGTKHMDFTDLPLFSPFPGKKLGSGERDTAEAMAIVNSPVPGFFQCCLKGEGVFTVQEIC